MCPTKTRSRWAPQGRGAIVLGKTNTSEFAHKAVTENPLFGVTRNPGGRAHARRLERRRRGRGRVGMGALALGTDGALDPHPGGVLRRLRPEAVVRPRAAPRGFPGFAHVSHVGRSRARSATRR